MRPVCACVLCCFTSPRSQHFARSQSSVGRKSKDGVSGGGKAGIATGWLGIWEAAPVPKAMGTSSARGPSGNTGRRVPGRGLPHGQSWPSKKVDLHSHCLILGASHCLRRCGPEGVMDPGQTSVQNKVVKEKTGKFKSK